MKQIAILLIATRKYKQFVQPLLQQIDQYFLPGHKKMVFLFTDEFAEYKSVTAVTQLQIPALKFPQATLYRYKIFSIYQQAWLWASHVFYLDVDMQIVDTISQYDILSNGLVAVGHPGFYTNKSWGSPNNNPNSESWLDPVLRRMYYAGGVQGGERICYMQACDVLAGRIDKDDAKGIIAEHNDETHWNWYLNFLPVFKMMLTPSFCMVQEPERRREWGIDDLPVKIIALTKNHEEIRS